MIFLGFKINTGNIEKLSGDDYVFSREFVSKIGRRAVHFRVGG
jgi:hypothetical protein